MVVAKMRVTHVPSFGAQNEARDRQVHGCGVRLWADPPKGGSEALQGSRFPIEGLLFGC